MADGIYARQSVDKKDSISIEGQIELCRRECCGEPRIFTDRGYSGKNLERPSFKDLLRAVEAGEISKVVVYRLDRLSRSVLDFGRVWELFDKHNVEFCSVSEKFDTTTPVGRAMITIIMTFAQLERETIAQRIKDNYLQRAKRGAWMGGPAPYGFKLARVPIGGKMASTFLPDEHIETVKEIFRRYAYTGASLGKIARWLTDSGMSGIGRKAWDNVSISRILHNPAYVRANADVYLYYKAHERVLFNPIEEYTGVKALWLWGKRDRNEAKYTADYEQLVAIAHHDGVIDSDTWLRCQYKLDENRQLKKSGAGSRSWLSGLIKCGYCGYAMRVVGWRDKNYVQCTGRTHLHICDVKPENSNLQPIEDSAAAALRKYLSERRTGNMIEDPKEAREKNQLKIELTSIEDKIHNLVNSLADMTGPGAKYVNESILKLDTQRAVILDRINRMQQAREIPLPDKEWDEMNFDQKKLVAHQLLKKVLKYNDHVEIVPK